MYTKKNRLVLLFLLLVLSAMLFGRETDIRNVQKGETGYGFSLDEIRERLECIYQLETMRKPYMSSQFGELGSLPQGKSIDIHVYLAKGNRILFLPESRANADMDMEREGMTCKAYYSEALGGYLFYLMCDWEVYEMGVPLNSLESSTLWYCMVTDDKNAHLADAAAMGLCDGIYGADELAYLGQIQADFSEKALSGLYPVEDTDNGYIDAVAGYVTEKLAQEGEYGKYVIYLNDMYRVQREKRSFGETECYMDCVIEGNGRSEYAEFIIYDHGDIDGSVFPLSGPHLADSQGYFSDYHAGDENGEYIRKIIERKRGTVALEVTGQAEENTKESDDDQNPDCDSAVDFRELPAGEIARWLSYVCSYSEWFGLTELGSVAGEFGRLNGQQIVMYSWTNTGEALFFVPMDRVNTCLKKADGEICPVYVNEMGDMEFYKLDSRQFTDSAGQMDTSLIETENLEPCLIESFTKISETEKIVVEELTNFEMPPIENDMFVTAFTRQVGELLKQADRKGTYTVRIGEYESVCSNQVCISAAVTGGQDEYYIRYLIVRYGDDRYFFWPAGFGTDESLEECAGKKHGMNQTCIERTRLLNRTEIKIEGGILKM